MREISFQQALDEAMAEEMRRDPRVFALATLRNPALEKEFGDKRVRFTPISEAAFTGTTLVYEAEADGFLRKMVRSMVGGLVAAGRGAVAIEDLARALEARDRRAWPAPAAARGLPLVRVLSPAGMLG